MADSGAGGAVVGVPGWGAGPPLVPGFAGAGADVVGPGNGAVVGAGLAESDGCALDAVAELDGLPSSLEEVRAPHPARLAAARVIALKTESKRRGPEGFMVRPLLWKRNWRV